MLAPWYEVNICCGRCRYGASMFKDFLFDLALKSSVLYLVKRHKLILLLIRTGGV